MKENGICQQVIRQGDHLCAIGNPASTAQNTTGTEKQIQESPQRTVLTDLLPACGTVPMIPNKHGLATLFSHRKTNSKSQSRIFTSNVLRNFNNLVGTCLELYLFLFSYFYH